MNRLLLITGCVLALFFQAAAQGSFRLAQGRKQVELPFDYINNFIILNLNFNGFLPLRFIFDTGAEHTILTKRQISDIFHVQYEREFKVTGSDMRTPLIAYLARRIRFDIPDKVSGPSEDILVLQDDYFRFEEYAGIDVHGILSAVVFSKFIIKINYDRQVITLYEREGYKPEEGFIPIPVEIFRNKIYLNTSLQVLPDSVAAVKLLIDTGAGLPLLLFSDTHPAVHPPANALPSNIGMGLGGYIEGFTGRVHRVELGDYSQRGVITYFQHLDTTQNLEFLNHRNGLIGNTLLGHYQIILDYQNSKIWLKPGKSVQEAYVYDRSGLSIIATGPKFNDYLIQNVLPNSPGAEAGIQRGDEIIRIRRTPVSFFSLGDIQRILQKKPGKKIRIVVNREGKHLKKTITLRELL